MNISITYYPNGTYKGSGSTPTGYKQYYVGISLSDILTTYHEIKADDVLRIIHAIKKNRDKYLIKFRDQGNGIRDYSIHFTVTS